MELMANTSVIRNSNLIKPLCGLKAAPQEHRSFLLRMSIRKFVSAAAYYFFLSRLSPNDQKAQKKNK